MVYLIVGLPALLGFLLIGYALLLRRLGESVRNWPIANGTITHASVKHFGYSQAGETGGPRTYWSKPIIRYRYTVRGRGYTGERIFYGPMSRMPHEAALAILKRYKEGDQVLVFFQHAAPTQAVLESRADEGLVSRLVVGGVILLLPFGGLMLLSRG
jgi:hypothetical protein